MASVGDTDFPEIVERSFNTGTKGSHFRIMQWNILADGYSHSSPTENFCAVPPSCLEWNFRYVQIMKHIQQLDADIVCLEEVDHFDQTIGDLTKKGYEGDFCLRKGTEVRHGVALFFKIAKFDLVETHKEYLHEEDGKVGNQGLLIKVLNEKKTNKNLIIAVVHLKAKRPFAERRCAQTKSALNILKALSGKYKGAPIVWAGDFNGEITEPFHKEISESPLELLSSYEQVLKKEPEFTTWKIRPTYEESHTIDYIWFTKDKLVVKDVLLPMEGEKVPKSRYPSFDHPSDHISLCSEFDFK